jgi:Zn-dependent protease with chaperone function
MVRNCGYRFLLVLMSVTIVCFVMTVTHRFMHALMFWGMSCCLDLSMVLSVVTAAWFVVSVRIVIFVTLLIGLGLVLRPLWRTYRFVASLNAACSTCPHPLMSDRLLTLCAELNLTSQIVVLTTPIPLAFCFGLLKPRICLSTGLVNALSAQELKSVLLHEDFHRRHYDPLRTLLADSMASVLFFLPAAAEWRDMFLTATELAADRHVIRMSGRLSLAGALHKLLTHPLATQFSTAGMTGITGFSATNARLVQLLGNAPLHLHFSPRSLISSSLLLILVCMVLQIVLF